MAKSTAVFCGLNGEPIDSIRRNERGLALEDALKADGTKVIRLKNRICLQSNLSTQSNLSRIIEFV